MATSNAATTYLGEQATQLDFQEQRRELFVSG